jgi:nitroimidazol reductase NimA-like FMN-containing flavoprotein (pyridoxamine 5'-phosphate oxidase superfamily)
VPDEDPALDEAQWLGVLERSEFLELLTPHRFLGRVGLIANGRPLTFPVNDVSDAETVGSCTATGTKLDAIGDGADVVFDEIDDHKLLYHSGRSVLVKGGAQVVTDEREVARLRAGRLRPWVRGAGANWIPIEIGEITERKLPTADPPRCAGP